ncbi:BRD4-interacting chromatin-remodeling complex-associated protein-like isoform X2 [Neopelma chrysocephalum]|uniref:BRD4-interacting chromatin-remodeling complex-associated protein-like isoform X2 n=1 Tax=Neopelma chrysocephalum TaxID=114329 RepID=UPI000FCCFD8A|nr:BRD4-interacting chromatin-remodeling complex-associated protein-like isoform X2 [Neopelma chrysocephalum]
MARCRPWSTLCSLIPPDPIVTDDEDSWGLSDVFCDPQVVNHVLPGSRKTDCAAILDSTEDAASSFFEGAGLWESSGSLLTAELSQPTASTGLTVPQDASLAWQWDSGAAVVGPPCDLLQQCLWAAGITEQLLEAEAKQDVGSFQPQVAFSSTLQLCSAGTDVQGLQPRAGRPRQKGNIQPFPQHLGPFSSLQGPGGTLGVGPCQAWGQQVTAQPVQQVMYLQQVPQGIISQGKQPFPGPPSCVLGSSQGQLVPMLVPLVPLAHVPTALPRSAARSSHHQQHPGAAAPWHSSAPAPKAGGVEPWHRESCQSQEPKRETELFCLLF